MRRMFKDEQERTIFMTIFNHISKRYSTGEAMLVFENRQELIIYSIKFVLHSQNGNTSMINCKKRKLLLSVVQWGPFSIHVWEQNNLISLRFCVKSTISSWIDWSISIQLKAYLSFNTYKANQIFILYTKMTKASYIPSLAL